MSLYSHWINAMNIVRPKVVNENKLFFLCMAYIAQNWDLLQLLIEREMTSRHVPTSFSTTKVKFFSVDWKMLTTHLKFCNCFQIFPIIHKIIYLEDIQAQFPYTSLSRHLLHVYSAYGEKTRLVTSRVIGCSGISLTATEITHKSQVQGFWYNSLSLLLLKQTVSIIVIYNFLHLIR
jgi:hypothetical protein